MKVKKIENDKTDKKLKFEKVVIAKLDLNKIKGGAAAPGTRGQNGCG